MTISDSHLSIADLHPVATAFAIEWHVSLSELSQPLEDKQRLAAGLLLQLSLTIDRPIANVCVERIDRIAPTGRNQGLIDFKLICRPVDRPQVHLGICVLPFLDLERVEEACTRLLVYKDFGLDRLCLLRQDNLMADIQQLPTCLPKLLSPQIGGRFIPLRPKDIVTILTVLSVFQNKQQHHVTNEMICAYLRQPKLSVENELISRIVLTAGS
ncbi:hypothetical protein [Chamaesiphon minutus]|uniref:hypothetical protein n=1 Tax=Chamaesiphon minutus TaxID=1173032 RepID=UPI0002F1B4A9|nr:hypothetical protein [Chamaesiphon minutus]